MTAAVAIETTLGLGLALLCVRELPFIRTLRMVLIVPDGDHARRRRHRLPAIYASDVGLFTSLSGLVGGGSIGILDNERGAFWGLVFLDVWEWTPLIFLILLAGLHRSRRSRSRRRASTARAPGEHSWITRYRC